MENGLEELLQNGPVIVNVGLREFAESVQEQEAEVIHVDWTPPAAGDQEMEDLLDKLL
jgi:FdrA protein